MMTISNSIEGLSTASQDIDHSTRSNWDSLYCTHLWENSHLRQAIINAPFSDNKCIKYCYTCRGKIRQYEVKSPRCNFVPNDHSTPNRQMQERKKTHANGRQDCISEEYNGTIERTITAHPQIDANMDNNQCIPSISQRIDSSFRQKYTSYEMRPDTSQQRLRKSLKGFGCIVNFTLTESPIKKRTQIQACSIIVMIVAIVVISFVLVNFTTPSFTRATKVISTIVVPTPNKLNESFSLESYDQSYAMTTTIMNVAPHPQESTSVDPPTTSAANNSILNVISKIRKNIKTYPKKSEDFQKKNNRDLSKQFCSCQTDEVCMLEETPGTAVCRKAKDVDDPTGCGGLCALETEACQLVDRARGVRVCRLLTLVTCTSEEWRCRNGLCVPLEGRCDGVVQCYDRSDEMHCECDLTRQFRCGHSISCFQNSKLCDGVIDCWDGFDEVNCTAECPNDQFTCTDGECIVSSRFCDGLADCGDGSDEPQGCAGACGAHELRCANHRCVPRAARCDGIDHCGDSTDETNCSA